MEARARTLIGDDPALGDVVSGLTRHFHEVMDEIDRRIRGYFGESVLAGVESFAQFRGQAPFLDGHVHVVQPGEQQDQELLVLGDLHGCYSCLKAALLQGDFFARRQAHLDNPEANPPISLVLLGDYIDRGRFSFSGTLRTAMQLQARMPDSVYMLRGNHEYYLDLDGRVVAPVRPCEAMDSISGVADNSVFQRYMRLFEDLPNMLVFGDIIFEIDYERYNHPGYNAFFKERLG